MVKLSTENEFKRRLFMRGISNMMGEPFSHRMIYRVSDYSSEMIHRNLTALEQEGMICVKRRGQGNRYIATKKFREDFNAVGVAKMRVRANA